MNLSVDKSAPRIDCFLKNRVSFMKKILIPNTDLELSSIGFGTANAGWKSTWDGEAADRMFEVLDANPDIMDAPDAVELETLRGDITFKNVSFHYNPKERQYQRMFKLLHNYTHLTY